MTVQMLLSNTTCAELTEWLAYFTILAKERKAERLEIERERAEANFKSKARSGRR